MYDKQIHDMHHLLNNLKNNITVVYLAKCATKAYKIWNSIASLLSKERKVMTAFIEAVRGTAKSTVSGINF